MDTNCIRSVVLRKNIEDGHLGFSIMGGVGYTFPPVIYDIINDSPASRSGMLEAGDIILAINEREVVKLTIKEILKCLRLSGDIIHIKYKRDPHIVNLVRQFLSTTLVSSGGGQQQHQQHPEHHHQHQQQNVVQYIENTPLTPTPTLHTPTHSNNKNPIKIILKDDMFINSTNDGFNNTPTHGNTAAGVGSGESKIKYETFVMTGDAILNLTRKDTNDDFRPPRSTNIISKLTPMCGGTPAPTPPAPSLQQPTTHIQQKSTPPSSSTNLPPHAIYSEKIKFQQQPAPPPSPPPPPPPPPIPSSSSTTTSESEITTRRQFDSSTLPPPPNFIIEDCYDDMGGGVVSGEGGENNTREGGGGEIKMNGNEDTSISSSVMTSDDDDDECGGGEKRDDDADDENRIIIVVEGEEKGRRRRRRSEVEGIVGEEDGEEMERYSEYILLNSEQHEENNLEQTTTTTNQDSDSDLDSISISIENKQIIKEIDRPSAERLAKRLYNLDGFKSNDISKQLSKSNEFSKMVGVEYLKYFHFHGDALDVSLRKFLAVCSLRGETQEKERILNYFSYRYIECNPGIFTSQDAVHTLVCALMLLNTDIYSVGLKKERRMNCKDFITNLSGLNDGMDFPEGILKKLYHSIKMEPLSSPGNPDDDDDDDPSQQDIIQIDVINSKEFKRGYLKKKSTFEPGAKKTPLGKRSWKMYFIKLKELILILQSDESSKQIITIKIHHAYAHVSKDYLKKPYVFVLICADHSQYLFQSSDTREMNSWIDNINLNAAKYSSPALEPPCGSIKCFEKPLLPSSLSRMSTRDQLIIHSNCVIKWESELDELNDGLNGGGGNKKSNNKKEYKERYSFYQYEIRRYRCYIDILERHLKENAADMNDELIELSILPSIPPSILVEIE